MEKKLKNSKNKIIFGKLIIMVTISFLIAISIVCGKYLAFNIGEVFRFSIENLPVMLSAILFGPIVGAVTGMAADLIGSLMVGYAINPIITIGAATIGGMCGVSYKILSRYRVNVTVRVVISVILAHIFGSVIIKTIGLSVFYDMPFMVLVLWRFLNYLVVGIVEILLILALLKNKGIQNMIIKIRGKK